MATRGSTAKTNVINTIAKAFGDHYLGEHDKKLIVEADDGGTMVQIAITLTAPKSNVLKDDMSQDGITSTPQNATVEFTPAERDTIEAIIQRLNL